MVEENQEMFERLNKVTDEFRKFCLKMQQDYNFYYEGLETIDGIIKEINSKIADLDARSQSITIDVDMMKSLQQEKEELLKELSSWQKESKDYMKEYNDIKTQLKKIGITTENAMEFPENKNYSKLIKGVASYDALIKKENPNMDAEYIRGLLNNLYKEVFNVSEDLIPDKTVIEEISNEEYDKALEEAKKAADVKGIVAADGFTVEPIDDSFQEVVLADPSELVVEEEAVIANPYHVFEPIKTEEELQAEFDSHLEQIKKDLNSRVPEESKVPTFLEKHVEVIKEEKEASMSKIVEEASQRRIEDYNHYRDTLYQKMDEYSKFKENMMVEIQSRIANNQSFEDLTEEYQKQKEMNDLVSKEIQRISNYTEEDKKNVYLNMNIPASAMAISEIEEHLKNKTPYEFIEIEKEEVREYPTMSGVPEETELDKIAKWRNAGLTNEEIEILLNAEEKKQKKEQFKESTIGRAFKWIKNATNKTKEYVSKHKKAILTAAIGLAIGTAALNGMHKQNVDPVEYSTEIGTNDNDLVKGMDESIPESTQSPAVSDNEMGFGDAFIISDGTMIYTDEYLDNPNTPYFSPDTVRNIISFGIKKADGRVERVYTEERRQELLGAGGEYVSVQSFDGFFNINEIEVQKGLKR